MTTQAHPGHRYFKPTVRHCWHLVHTGPRTLLWRCCECGKHKRTYRPGMNPVVRISWRRPSTPPTAPPTPADDYPISTA